MYAMRGLGQVAGEPQCLAYDGPNCIAMGFGYPASALPSPQPVGGYAGVSPVAIAAMQAKYGAPASAPITSVPVGVPVSTAGPGMPVSTAGPGLPISTAPGLVASSGMSATQMLVIAGVVVGVLMAMGGGH